MDVKRTVPGTRMRKGVMVWIVGALALIAVLLATRGSAEPVARYGEIIVDTVRRAELTVAIRATGTLTPERLRWLTAQASARVDRIVAQSGGEVTAGDLVLVLANPDVEIQALQADQQLAQAEATLLDLNVALRGQLLTQEGVVATLATQLDDATQEAAVADSLLRHDLIPRLEARSKRARAEEFTARMAIERQRLDLLRASIDTQVQRQAAQVERLRAIAAFQRTRVSALRVEAPESGVLQDLTLQPGQWVTEGTLLAKVIQPGSLKAVLRVSDQQARNVVVGQSALIDTRSGIVPGRVTRKDPASQGGYVAVDVGLPDSLPNGAVPDLGVDGTIEVERLGTVLQMGRPARIPESGQLSVFRIDADGRTATRVPVQLGRATLTAVEIVRGLNPGDRVILSDLPEWSGADRIRLKSGSNQ